MTAVHGFVTSLARSATHSFSKHIVDEAQLVAGIGMAGDVHCGETVQHRSRVAVDPNQPNLRQVHLIASELLENLNGSGFSVGPGDLGENIITSGIDLLGLPRGALLQVGDEAVLEITGLRNPCAQIEAFSAGLLAQVVERAPDGSIVRKAGVMAIVVAGGSIRTGDRVIVKLPPPPHFPLDRV